jgi:hypothetical protein
MPYKYHNIPKSFWVFLGIALLPVGYGLGSLLLKTSELQFTNNRGDTLSIESTAKIRRATNDTEYANKVLAQKILTLENQIDFFLKNQQRRDPTLEIIQENVEAIAPVIEEIEKSNQELQEAVSEVSGNSI